jgi:hypothetical protein
MKSPEHDQLLKEILADRNLGSLKQSSLGSGLAALRETREARQIRRLAALAIVPALVFLVILASQVFQFQRSAKRSFQPRDTLSQPQGSSVKMITDEELFALFPNRSMALVGKPGHQELVFLDQRRSTRARTQ